MTHIPLESTIAQAADQVLGYLNFSSGVHDASVFSNLNLIFGHFWSPSANGPTTSEAAGRNQSQPAAAPEPAYRQVAQVLRQQLDYAQQHMVALKDARQAQRVLKFVFDDVLPAYLAFHRDLLGHQREHEMFNAFFIGRTFEVVLTQIAQQVPDDELLTKSLRQLNDYLGTRPVAALESQRIEPYEHEWVRPIPVYVRDVGVAHGRYYKIVSHAIDVLRRTDPNLLETAQFDLDLLDELAIDPRAFDFNHPLNKRPNYHFGQWDEHLIDQQGFYRRFIIHQITLEALLARVSSETELDSEELMVEAGAVLAGTMLMASGIIGRGPGAYDSTMQLSQLMPKIAAYRDQFYQQLLAQLPEAHRQRLQQEAGQRQQPFGAARQHLNADLANRRAYQMVHVSLAQIYARMGYMQASERQAMRVAIASARIITQIDGSLTYLQQITQQSRWDEVIGRAQYVIELLHRGIECGAIVDPWNILGFDAHYSLFQSPDSAVRDHRVDELLEIIERIFATFSNVWISAAAENQDQITDSIANLFREMAQWWHQYATHEVSSVEAANPWELFEGTRSVAQALGLLHQQGGQAGSIEFWAPHADLFTTPRAYELAIGWLIDHEDFDTSMVLLIHWLSQSEVVPLQQRGASLQELASRWIHRQRRRARHASATPQSTLAVWDKMRKFYDYLEANADAYWQVPDFQYAPDISSAGSPDESLPPSLTVDDDDNDLYQAAYEGVVFRDTTDDGYEGNVYDGSDSASDQSEDAIEAEAERLADRLDFLEVLCELWSAAAMLIPMDAQYPGSESRDRSSSAVLPKLAQHRESIASWLTQAQGYSQSMRQLLQHIAQFPLPRVSDDPASLTTYNRHRMFKESLLERVMQVCVEMDNAARHLAALNRAVDLSTGRGEPVASSQAKSPRETPDASGKEADRPKDDAESAQGRSGERPTGNKARAEFWAEIFASILRSDVPRVRVLADEFLEQLEHQTLLYVPLSKGGDPIEILETRVRQYTIGELLDALPRLGLFAQTRELIHLVLVLERNQSFRTGAVTEFDELFRTAYLAMVETLVVSVDGLVERMIEQGEVRRTARHQAEEVLFECLETLTESMLMVWLAHSRTLRLSVIEKVHDHAAWKRLVEFIQKYGKDLFTQILFNRAYLGAILHMGVDRWLTHVQQSPEPPTWKLLGDLERGLSRKTAVRHISLVFEAIYENFLEYRDFNSTTTQSDHGELIFILLDFLRLRSKYDRISWHLRPVMWAHEVLVRSRQTRVARQWRRSLTDRVAPEAEKFLTRLSDLQEKYSVQLATVGQRLSERLVHPMHVEQLLALVEPAMQNPLSSESQHVFEVLEQQVEMMTRRPLGAGVDIPKWLAGLEEEVARVLQRRSDHEGEAFDQLLPPVVVPLERIREDIQSMPRHL